MGAVFIFCENYYFADISVKAEFKHEYLKNACHEYLTDKSPEITVCVLKEDIEKEKEISRNNNDFNEYTEGYLEFLAFYRKFCETVANKGVILLHGCAIAVEHRAYIFTAPSGTGKTTHAKLWLKELGEKAHILNGDKPLIKIEGTSVLAYGTPWDGKEHMSRNEKLPVEAICLLERAKKNKITVLADDEKLSTLLTHTYRPKNPEKMQDVLSTILGVIPKIKFYHLFCDISHEAAALSIQAMIKGEH